MTLLSKKCGVGPHASSRLATRLYLSSLILSGQFVKIVPDHVYSFVAAGPPGGGLQRAAEFTAAATVGLSISQTACGMGSR
jgi:hypothetical protein